MQKFLITAVLAILALPAVPAHGEIDGPVLVFGGTSGVGLETVKLLRARDIDVTVFVRPTSDLEKLRPLGVSLIVGDALVSADVNRAFASDNFSAVISSLGGRRGEPRPDAVGNSNITNAAAAKGVRRAVQVSSIGAGASAREVPSDPTDFMANILHQKTLGEDHLVASGLDFTIVRPGGLRNDAATGRGILSESLVSGSISRADVALLIIQVLDDTSSIGKIYHVVDPGLSD